MSVTDEEVEAGWKAAGGDLVRSDIRLILEAAATAREGKKRGKSSQSADYFNLPPDAA